MFGLLFGKIDKKKIKSNISNVVSYAKILALLCILWIVFSGSRDIFLITCGIISITFVFFLCIYLNIFSVKSYIIKLSFLRYVYFLFKDIILSALKIISIVYSDKLKIDPGIIEINTERLTDQEKVLFSNLITMTPGTFVIAVEGNSFLIHALNREDLDFNNNKEISKLLIKMR